MYYIGTPEEINAYLETVNSGEKYTGITKRWAETITSQDQTEAATIKNENYINEELAEVENLPARFLPPEV